MEEKQNSDDKNQPVQSNQSTTKPLAEKSDAEIKRETRARLKHLDSDSAAELLDEVVRRPVSGTVHGFTEFLRAHAIVGLAVGFVLGAQVQLLANQLIKSFLEPMLQLLTGNNLTDRFFVLHFNGNVAFFHWGSFVYTLIDFLFVIGVLYVIIKVLKLEKLDKQN